VKNLLEQLQNICNELKDENEIIIMKKYGNNAKYYTIKMIGKSIIETSKENKINDKRKSNN